MVRNVGRVRSTVLSHHVMVSSISGEVGLSHRFYSATASVGGLGW